MSSSNNATFTATIVRLNGDEYPCGGDNRVEIPYEEEYKIVVKNLMGKRRAFKIFVDGESLSGGKKFVLRPYATMEVERFLENDLKSGRKLQWLPLDHKSVQHKKGRTESGMIRIVMWKEASTVTSTITYRYDPCPPYRPYRPWIPYPRPYRPWFEENYWWNLGSSDLLLTHNSAYDTTAGGPSAHYTATAGESVGSSVSCSAQNFASTPGEGAGTYVRNAISSPEGATGKGGYSGQRFRHESEFDLDPDVDEVQFFLVPPAYQITDDGDEEVFVASGSVYCVRCGLKRKKDWKYCPRCGESF